LKARGRPACAGYVVGFEVSKHDPTRVNWKVKVQAGPRALVGKKFCIESHHVPKNIHEGMDVLFDVDDHGVGKPVAINVFRVVIVANR